MKEETNISNLAGDAGRGSMLSGKEEVLSRKYLLKGRTIGVSISESDNLSELGYGVAHLRDAIVEITRYILAAGGNVAYGGDMRQGGFTELIFDLLVYYRGDKELQPSERFYSYLAYPISTTLTLQKEAELKQIVSFRKVAPPEDLILENPTEFIPPNSTENLYIWTRCLTQMRQQMESACDARIFIGGRTRGFKGKSPGILEELLIAIQYKHPIYLVGAFGGVTKDIIDLLKGHQVDIFSNEHYFDNTSYKDLLLHYNAIHPEDAINYNTYSKLLQSIGLNGIAELNGLSIEDNLRLTNTPHISEAVFLILKGLTNRYTK